VLEAPPLADLNVGAGGVVEEGLYGGFSPRVMPCPIPQSDDVMTVSESVVKGPVMAIMPELQELCGELAPPVSMVHREVDSTRTSSVASISPSPELSHPLVFVDSETLFAKELGSLLLSLETAIPGSSKEIVYLLSEKDTGGKIKKVKDYLRTKCKKSGTTRKASAAA
jgi:hypothetical protein